MSFTQEVIIFFPFKFNHVCVFFSFLLLSEGDIPTWDIALEARNMLISRLFDNAQRASIVVRLTLQHIESATKVTDGKGNVEYQVETPFL